MCFHQKWKEIYDFMIENICNLISFSDNSIMNKLLHFLFVLQWFEPHLYSLSNHIRMTGNFLCCIRFYFVSSHLTHNGLSTKKVYRIICVQLPDSLKLSQDLSSRKCFFRKNIYTAMDCRGLFYVLQDKKIEINRMLRPWLL